MSVSPPAIMNSNMPYRTPLRLENRISSSMAVLRNLNLPAF
jgi:hypothetical protein